MATLRVDPAGIVITVRHGESLLAALSRSGYTHRFGCRRGGCGICKVELVSGEISYPAAMAEGVLDGQEREAGVCLSCRGVPVTDVVIRLRPDDRLRCVAPLLAALAERSANSEEGES